MRSHLGVSLLVVIFIWSFFSLVNNGAQGKCLDDQRALLLQLNQSIFFGTLSSKRDSWRLNTDCCSWGGIACDRAGHVISLDLRFEWGSSELNKSSSLFKLGYLVRLNLAQSMVDYAIPSGFDQLTNLEYLNLSYSGEFGQIPIEISRMTRLITLDFSRNGNSGSYLTDPDLGTLIRNLTQLRQLLLDGVFLSGQATKWCHTISSFLPKLEVLSLCECGISGPFDSSLLKLRSLSVLQLDDNKMFAEVPKFFSKFHNLTTLHLAYCELYGKFPERIFQLPMLQSIDLSWNDRLQGSLPEFPKDGLLHELVVSFTSFTNELPNSIGYLKFLSRLELRSCRFNGSIPTSFSNLNQLEHLDLSNNSFTGSIAKIEWKKFRKLVTLELANNLLNGQFQRVFSPYHQYHT
ncbi:hypothetical protein MKW92_002785 [Papaver armeniacum]|nr:hypothetical protein MKW92_002785 [Papaver armeniacum]